MLFQRPTATLVLLCSLLLPWCIGAPALAVQHPVNPGDNWEALGPKIKPGDEIVLLPGKHRPASFDRLVGNSKRRIVIRSADPSNPALIEGSREVLCIKHAAHLLIKDIHITGGTIAGISLSSSQKRAAINNPIPGAKPEPVPAGNVRLENVTIERIGPANGRQRHAMVIWGLEHVQIENCNFHGWGGAAIDLVACNDVSVLNCGFKAHKDHLQLFGIRTRAGTSRVQIEKCKFENAGDRVLCLGGESDLEEFMMPGNLNDPSARLVESADVRVERCLILGGKCAVSFVNADDCVFRNNTVVRPTATVLALLASQKDPRFTTGRRNIMGLNIITWQPGELKAYAETDRHISEECLILEENVWWSGEAIIADGSDGTDPPGGPPVGGHKKLGAFPGRQQSTQITDTDPKLDAETFRSAEERFKFFGY